MDEPLTDLELLVFECAYQLGLVCKRYDANYQILMYYIGGEQMKKESV